MVSILGFGKASGFVVDRHTWGGCETSYHVPCMLTNSAKCSNVAVLHMIHSLERGAEVKVSFFCLDNSVFALTKEWDGGNNSEDRRSPPKTSCIIYVMFFLLILMSLVLCTLCLVSGADIDMDSVIVQCPPTPTRVFMQILDETEYLIKRETVQTWENPRDETRNGSSWVICQGCGIRIKMPYNVQASSPRLSIIKPWVIGLLA